MESSQEPSQDTLLKSQNAKVYLETHLKQCANTSPQERLRRRRRLGSWMPETALSNLRDSVQNICSRNLSKLTVGIDLPRLLKNIQVTVGSKKIFPSQSDFPSLEKLGVLNLDTSRQYKDSCDDLTLFSQDTDLSEKIITSDINQDRPAITGAPIVSVLKHFLLTLSKVLDPEQDLERLSSGLQIHFPTEDVSDGSLIALSLKDLIREAKFYDDGFCSARVLKACNQASIAPFVKCLKLGLGSRIAFNSVRNSWKIHISIASSSIMIVHDMAEKISNINHEQQFCTFQWQARILFDENAMVVKMAEFDILEVSFSEFWTDKEEEEMYGIFKKYGYEPAKSSRGAIKSESKNLSFFSRLFSQE